MNKKEQHLLSLITNALCSDVFDFKVEIKPIGNRDGLMDMMNPSTESKMIIKWRDYRN